MSDHVPMIIGHLPAGYVANHLMQRTCWRRLTAGEKRLTTWIMCLGSLAPDFDMFYFYFVDAGKHHHHTFWPHLPAVWLGIGTVLALGGVLLKSRRLLLADAALMIAVFLHLVCDTIAGGIAWFYPWSGRLITWFYVPAVHKPWWLNFFLHWTFLFEVAVIVWAGLILRRRRKTS
jgi:hypothetical protein